MKSPWLQKPKPISVVRGQSLFSRRLGGLSWVYAGAGQGRDSRFIQWLLGDDSPDWGQLAQDKRVRLVKSNPLRQIYRVRLDDANETAVLPKGSSADKGGLLEICEVYVKIYYPINLLEEVKWYLRGSPGQIEFEHLREVMGRSIPATEPLAWSEGKVNGKKLGILITRSLGSVVSLEDIIWGGKPIDKQRISEALKASAQVVARLHKKSILHNDLHGGNILLRLGPAGSMRGYITDLGNVRIAKKFNAMPLDVFDRRNIANVAMLAMSLRVRINQEQLRTFVEGYLAEAVPPRQWTENEINKYLVKLKIQEDKQYIRLCKRRDRRAMRNSRYARKIRLGDGWSGRVFLCSKHPADYSLAGRQQFTRENWLEALASPETLAGTGEVLKAGGHNTVKAGKMRVGGVELDVVVKRTRLRSGLRGFIQAISPSRAIRQWRYGQALVSRRIDTAWPLAALERRKMGLLSESIFISERIPDSVNLDQYCRGKMYRNPAGRIKMAQMVGKLLGQLGQLGFEHRDCKGSNILVGDAGKKGQERLFLVDMDGLSRQLWPRFVRNHMAIVRLAASILAVPGITRGDFGRAFNSYIKQLNLPEVHNRLARHELWQKISDRAERKARRTTTLGILRGNFENILIIKPSSLGDVVRCLAILNGLRGRYPLARIDWLVQPVFAGILKNNPQLDEIIEFDRRHFGKIGRSWRATRDFIKFISDLRSRRYDLVLDLQGLFRSGFISFASGSPMRIGFADAREWAWVFYTHRVKTSTGREHVVDSYWQFSKLLGFEDTQKLFEIPIKASVKKEISRLLGQKGLKRAEHYVVMLPGGTEQSKRWPPERFAGLADEVNKCYDMRIILLGAGPCEEKLAQQIKHKAAKPVVIDLVGQTSLEQMAAIIKGASIVVGNDSGPLHVSAAMSVATVGLYGPTDRRVVGPYGQMDGVVEAGSDIPRSERYSPLAQHRIDNITVEQVLEKVSTKLKK